MSVHKSRIRTLQALIAGAHCIANSSIYPILFDEIKEIYLVRKVRKCGRRRLMEMLHSFRMLDTMLKTFVQHHGCRSGSSVPHAMGPYLRALQQHNNPTLGNLTAAQVSHYQANIINKRNLYLHEAGAFPVNDHEVSIMISEIHSCMVIVLGL